MTKPGQPVEPGSQHENGLPEGRVAVEPEAEWPGAALEAEPQPVEGRSRTPHYGPGMQSPQRPT